MPIARVGLIVPRLGRTAVERNRVKRWLREAVRLDFLPDAPPVEIVLRTSKSAYDLSFASVRREVQRVAAMLRGGQD
jgi:ribonuclease P protein component